MKRKWKLIKRLRLSDGYLHNIGHVLKRGFSSAPSYSVYLTAFRLVINMNYVALNCTNPSMQPYIASSAFFRPPCADPALFSALQSAHKRQPGPLNPSLLEWQTTTNRSALFLQMFVPVVPYLHVGEEEEV